MIRLAARTVINLLSNGVALVVAAVALERMTLDWTALLVAAAIFTVVELLISPLIRQTALTKAPALLGSSALVATLVALVVTTLITDGMKISGLGTWLLAVVITWAVGLIAQLLLPLVLFKKALAARDQPARG